MQPFQYAQTTEMALAVVIFFMLIIALISLSITALIIWAYCRIFAKAGFHWALGLLMLVPLANLILIFVLAFTDWPIQKQLRQLQKSPANTP